MKELRYNLDSTQAALAATLELGDEMVIVVLAIQPHSNTKWDKAYSTIHGIMYVGEYGRSTATFQVLFPIGSTVLGREAWIIETEQSIPTGGYIYRATNRPEPDNGIIPGWYSSQCMPTRAIRHQFVVTANRVCKVQEIDIETMIDVIGFNAQAGFTGQDVINEFAKWFIKRFGKGVWEADGFTEVVTIKKVERE